MERGLEMEMETVGWAGMEWIRGEVSVGLGFRWVFYLFTYIYNIYIVRR